MRIGEAEHPEDEAVEAPVFSRELLPEGSYGSFVKVRETLAIRMSGTFSCLTSEGNIASCTGGWLAVDSMGHPYPINAEEFDLTYRQIGPNCD